LKYLAMISPLSLQMPKEEYITVKPIPHRRWKYFFMWTRSKQHNSKKEMARTRKRNLNLPHQEKIDEEVRSISALCKSFTKHWSFYGIILGHTYKRWDLSICRPRFLQHKRPQAKR
jgi:hypothetical protein